MKSHSCFAYFVVSFLLQSSIGDATCDDQCAVSALAQTPEPLRTVVVTSCVTQCGTLSPLLCINVSDVSSADAACALSRKADLQSCLDCLLPLAGSYYQNPSGVAPNACDTAQLPGYAKVTQCYGAYLTDRVGANLDSLTTLDLVGIDSGAVSEPEDAPEALPTTVEECKDMLGLYGCGYFLGDQTEYDATASIDEAKTCANAMFGALDTLFNLVESGLKGPVDLESIILSTDASDYGELQGLIERCENISGVPEYFAALVAPSPASHTVFSMTGLLITAVLAFSLI